MRTITEEYINEVWAAMWDEAERKHGTAWRVPRDEQYIIGETARGLYVAKAWQKDGSNGSAMAALSKASVNSHVAEVVITCHLGAKTPKKDEKSVTKTSASSGTKAKMQRLITNAVKNCGVQFTTKQLSEISGFSAQTTVKHLTSLKYYRKIKRGLYEARDPKKSK